MATKHTFSDYRLLTFSIGFAYLWFGLLKFFPGYSPAEDLANDTMALLTFGYLPKQVAYLLLAIWESALGLALIMGFKRKWASLLGLAHMAGTFTPLFLFPELSFTTAPFQWTLVGQYIFKNIVIVAGFIIIYRNADKI